MRCYKSVVKRNDCKIMSLELIKRTNGHTTKKQCVGCKYDRYENWNMSDKDNCYLCDTTGSERVQDTSCKATKK